VWGQGLKGEGIAAATSQPEDFSHIGGSEKKTREKNRKQTGKATRQHRLQREDPAEGRKLVKLTDAPRPPGCGERCRRDRCFTKGRRSTAASESNMTNPLTEIGTQKKRLYKEGRSSGGGSPFSRKGARGNELFGEKKRVGRPYFRNRAGRKWR